MNCFYFSITVSNYMPEQQNTKNLRKISVLKIIKLQISRPLSVLHCETMRHFKPYPVNRGLGESPLGLLKPALILDRVIIQKIDPT